MCGRRRRIPAAKRPGRHYLTAGSRDRRYSARSIGARDTRRIRRIRGPPVSFAQVHRDGAFDGFLTGRVGRRTHHAGPGVSGHAG